MERARRVFVTFLGTSKYETTVYRLPNAAYAPLPTPYVQEALLDLMDQGVIAFAPDVVLPVLTPEAERDNWRWRKGVEPDPDNPETFGLAPRLEAWVARQRQAGREVRVEPVRVDLAYDDASMWAMFDALYQRMARDGAGEGCEVVVDVTHSYRYQPMLILLLVHLARVVAGTRTAAVYYGSQPRDVDSTSAAAGFATPASSPVKEATLMDLSTLVELQEWILHVYTFLHGANAEGLWSFVKGKGRSVRRATAGAQDPELAHISDIEKLVEAWRTLTQSVQLCRGPALPGAAAESLHRLRQLAARLAGGESVPALQPVYYLLDTVRQQVEPLTAESPYESGLAAVRWCEQHGLAQQAYTMLRELLVTAVCDLLGIRMDVRRDREAAERRLSLGARRFQRRRFAHDPGAAKAGAGPALDDTDGWVEDMAETHPDLFVLWDKLSQARNDVDHGGWGRENTQSPAALRQRLTEYVDEMERILQTLGLLKGGVNDAPLA
ncbi:MAG: TM1812 family CRISPR-associated protein [Alicyclobacillaceae bacterium]|nr:TM1812 family CRISPR-associated protein [Alicyclobacillaceae bacterium]